MSESSNRQNRPCRTGSGIDLNMESPEPRRFAEGSRACAVDNPIAFRKNPESRGLIYSEAEPNRMSPEFQLTMDALKNVANWIASFVTWRKSQNAAQQAQADEALKSLMDAALQTQQHLGRAPIQPEEENRKIEIGLSALWSKAGQDMAPLNPTIAYTYLLKANYWSSPEEWTRQQKDDRIIQLDRVVRLGQEALLGTEAVRAALEADEATL
jgi:hypothetical protein